jgi:hypothetical protein
MEFENLKSAAQEITMPEEMKRRIAHNCKQIETTMEEHNMNNRKNTSFFRKPAAVFAALAVCLSLSVTALAATGVLQGFFRDITNHSGAIVGTSYEQATDEIDMDVTVDGDELTVLATFVDPNKFPYRESQLLGIADYRIMDADGNVVQEGATDKFTPVANGQASIVLELNGLATGSYKLIVTAFVSEKKADQPLNISGTWECEFSK